MYNDLLPQALLCGMTTYEFWYEEPCLLNSYIKKRELELDVMNYQAWLFGLYTYDAFSVVLSNAFSKEGSKQSTYFEKPLDEFYSKYKNQPNKKGEEIESDKYRNQYNYWAKFGKKGV